ncbi:MAG: hypothetical protein NW208_06280 [Bryobacter sp.]|nr:hypothetical protein [Bryobacter sp.]
MIQHILKFTLGLVLALSIGMGQEQTGRRLGDGKALEALNLTEEQKPKVQEIFAAQREALKDIRATGGGRQALKKVQDDTHAKLKEVLNEEQMKKYEELRKEMRGQMRRKR